MSNELFCKIIDELSKLNYSRNIYFNIYNEPLTDKRLPELVKYTRYKLPKTTIDIYTNGDYLDYNLYCLLREKGVDRFIISIHAEKPSSKLSETLNRLTNREKTNTIIIKNVYDDFKNKRDIFFNRGGSIETSRAVTNNKHCPYVLVCNIDFNGNVILCCNDYFSKHVFGNLRDQSFHEIWFDRDYIKLRNRIALGYRDLPLCKECNI
jgi:radical SAM protein with 4Fe4S-binding SPASM domain